LNYTVWPKITMPDLEEVVDLVYEVFIVGQGVSYEFIVFSIMCVVPLTTTVPPDIVLPTKLP